MALCKPVLAAEAFTEPSSIRDVADILGVSEAAVKQHFAHLYDKFEIYEGEERRRIKLANLVLARGVLTRADLGEASVAPEPGSSSAPGIEATTIKPSKALVAGREAVRFRNWEKAYAELSLADRTEGLPDVADLVALGDAALWSGKSDESIAARQRAHALCLQRGDMRSAAALALALVINNVVRLNMAVASGWFAKAKRYLDGAAPCLELGYLALSEAMFALAKGDAAGGLDGARQAFETAEQYHDNDLRALGLAFQGYALCQVGRAAEAAPFLDEAMASAVGWRTGSLGHRSGLLPDDLCVAGDVRLSACA